MTARLFERKESHSLNAAMQGQAEIQEAQMRTVHWLGLTQNLKLRLRPMQV